MKTQESSLQMGLLDHFFYSLAHLLGKAHDLQLIAPPDRRVRARVHQLIHLLHRLDGGHLGSNPTTSG